MPGGNAEEPAASLSRRTRSRRRSRARSPGRRGCSTARRRARASASWRNVESKGHALALPHRHAVRRGARRVSSSSKRPSARVDARRSASSVQEGEPAPIPRCWRTVRRPYRPVRSGREEPDPPLVRPPVPLGERSSSRTVPSSAAISPPTIRSSVVLPTPFRPVDERERPRAGRGRGRRAAGLGSCASAS